MKRSFILLCVLCVAGFVSSCTSPPSDLRSMVPGDALVYLETNDLKAALQPIIDSKPFADAAESKPDLSALKGVQLAIVVTGFELSEQKLSDDKSIGRVLPHFVAIADTHAWNSQANAFARDKIGGFVTEMYSSDADVETSDKDGGKYYKWTADDGRKAFALVIDSVIYFSNDEASIDKCMAVKRGEADSFAKVKKDLASGDGTLAAGFISQDGIAQISNFAAMQIASTGSDDAEAQSAIAGLLPQMIRNNFTEATWRMSVGPNGIEDTWTIKMPTEVAGALSETMQPSGKAFQDLRTNIGLPAYDFTLYDLKDPGLAWKSMIFVSKRGLDPVSAKIIDEAAPMLLEGYGIRKVPEFFTAAGNDIATVRGGNDAVEAIVENTEHGAKALKDSLAGPFKEQQLEAGDGVIEDAAVSADGDYAVIGANKGRYVTFGETDDVRTIAGSRDLTGEFSRTAGRFADSGRPPVLTAQGDSELPKRVADIFSDVVDSQTVKSPDVAVTGTKFTRSGMERRTVSDLGFIGWLVGQLSDEK